METEMQKMISAIVANRESMFKNALDHFQIPAEEITKRAEFVRSHDGTETLSIDGKLAITFNPVQYNFPLYEAKLTYVEHWRI